jgi:hypothetical protein
MSDIGQNLKAYMLAGIKDRYFYGLRRTIDGTLYMHKIDQMKAGESVSINVPGNPAENYIDFDQGTDFYEGRGPNHSLVYENLKYEQFRWDDVNLNYYVNDNGELVVRINATKDQGTVTYPETLEEASVQPKEFTFDRDVYSFDSNERTWDRT